MTIKEIYNLTAAAFETGHVKELLLGEGAWAVPNGNRFAAGNKPTDWERIVNYAIVPYCGSDKTDPKIQQFRTTFVSIVENNTPVALWAAFEIYSAYCYSVRSQSGNILFTPEIKDLLSDAIKRNEETLKENREWDGHLYENGLWDAIFGANSLLESDFGMGIL